ncbi:MAG: hypothetical protein QOE29_1196 [Gaiellaceae bacterium]|nr:hypothetical protein [Gaiellaceae bacterium]
MPLVGEHAVPKGPLAVRWLACEVGTIRAGARGHARVALENAGLLGWSHPRVRLAYHWLDELGNPILWDGLHTLLPHPVEPHGQLEATLDLRGPIPPGRYRIAFDLVDEGTCWFSEVGNLAPELEVTVQPRIERALAAVGGDAETERALAAQEEPLVDEATAEAVAYLAPGCAPAPDWSRRVLDAHQEGYALVGGSIAARAGLRRKAPAELAPWAPGRGRLPAFAEPLLCPSAVRGFAPDWADPVAGLPAAAQPDGFDPEPWLYDGRIALELKR